MIIIVKIIGAIFCLLGIFLTWFIAKKNISLKETKQISIGIFTLSSVTILEILTFISVFLIPTATITVANYHVIEGVHTVEACSRCHIMRPMVNDLYDNQSDTLASRHYKNRWIQENQCYSCHSNYGFTGDLTAKMEGFRHLARYTTHTYTEPIVAKHRYDNQQCLKCHSNMPKFQAVQSHHTVMERLQNSNLSCLNCHGKAHPNRADRTPGSNKYEYLMQKPKVERGNDNE